jgi:uncharacterized membrane protein YhhN
MISPFLVLKLGVFLLAGLLFAELKGVVLIRLAFKAPLSALFVLTALLQPGAASVYGLLIILGLVLCLVGDVCLALPGERAFKLGLASFLGGHLAYIVAFSWLESPLAWLTWRTFAVAGVSAAVFLWLKPHLGRLKIPVLAYVAAIALMVSAAWALRAAPTLSPRGPALVFYGAVLFYLSDLFVARDRFVSPGWLNRFLGLPLYYLGQFLLAFSIGLIA